MRWNILTQLSETFIHVSDKAKNYVVLEGAVGTCIVYVCGCCKGLKVCMNGRIFSYQRVKEQCGNSSAESGGFKDRRAPWSKKWGARAQRPNRSSRLCYFIVYFKTSVFAARPMSSCGVCVCVSVCVCHVREFCQNE